MTWRPVPGSWWPPPIGPRSVDTTPAEVEWRAQCDRCGTDATWTRSRDAGKPTCTCTCEPEEDAA